MEIDNTLKSILHDKKNRLIWISIFLLLLIFSFIRFYKLGDWSLWEDEETTIYYSQHLDKWFSLYSPVYFQMLAGFFKIGGISVWNGRLLSVICGIFTIYFIFYGFSAKISPKAALVSAALLSINLGHIFWSQSIRYYTPELLFNAISIILFLSGFEKSRPVWLVLSAIFWGFGLMCHFSAVLLGPVYLGYIMVLLFLDKKHLLKSKQTLISFFISFLIVFVFFLIKILEVQQYQLGINPPENKDFFHILITTIAYFGLPVIVVGIGSALFARTISKRMRIFFSILALIPVLEILVIAKLSLVNVITWYYGLVSLIGFCCLAGQGLVELLEGKNRKFGIGVLILSLGYYLVFNFSYFTDMHGDRPRWKDGAQYLKSQLGPGPEILKNKQIEIYATVAGTIEYYLGAPPHETHHIEFVTELRDNPPIKKKNIDQWFVVKASHINRTYSKWFAENCELKASFIAKTGPRDRSVLVYRVLPQNP